MGKQWPFCLEGNKRAFGGAVFFLELLCPLSRLISENLDSFVKERPGELHWRVEQMICSFHGPEPYVCVCAVVFLIVE